MKRRPSWGRGVEPLEQRHLLAAQPIITEFVADNKNSFADGDGNASDWIEIYNAGDAPADLAGWHLTDDAADLAKWTFPSRTLVPGEFLVVFASGQESDNYVDGAGYLHTNFKLDADGGYLALVKTDGATIATEFAAYPQQREDVAYGRGQLVSNTTLLASGASGKLLIPTAVDNAAIGSTWTGAAAFNDAAWQTVATGVGYETPPPPVTELRNVAFGKSATTNGAIYAGQTVTTITDGNRSSIVHGAASEPVGFKYEINLGGVYALSRIDIFPRQDGCCPERLTRYRVSVLLDNNGAPGAEVWSADMRMDGSIPAPGPTGPDSITSALDSDGLFEGQWIRVQALQNPVPSYSLQMGEIEVYSLITVPQDQINLAIGKTATASGPLYTGFTDPNRIIDGNRATFTHPLTPVTTFSYTIDLGATKSLDHINVVNRGDGCCPDRLTKYRVTVHAEDDGEFGPVVWSADIRTDGTNSGSGGVDLIAADLDSDGEFEGRFIRIEKIDDGSSNYWPQIAEVEVFAPTGYNAAITTDIEPAMLNVNASAYLRMPFNVADPSVFDALTLRMKDDDGFVAYLNGVEAARRNAPAGTPAYNASATDKHHAGAFSEFAISPALLHASGNVLAIHGLNFSAADEDFLSLPELVARTTTTVGAGFLTSPTPGDPNGTTVAGFVADTMFDVDRGFFTGPFDVQVTSATPGATIVYTTDGSEPTPTHGTAVAAPDANTPPTAIVHMTTTTALRAAAFKTGFEPSNVDTQTYLFLGDVIHQPTNPAGYPATWNGVAADYQMDPDVVNNPAYSDEIIDGLRSIPTMSIVMDPDDFLGPTDGIYTYPERLGIAYERPVSIEVINPDGTTFFQEDAGIRVWGTGWRPHSSTLKHSFQLKFKAEYGATKLEHQLFPDAPVGKFDDIILRAQGSRGWTDFRSGGLEIEATQYIHDNWARDTAVAMGKQDGHGTYVHLYINGLYWGLYNPVERPTGNFGEEYFGGDSTDYDVISHRTGEPVVANEGDLVAWNQTLATADAGLANAANYAQVAQMVDLDNLIDYMLVNTYATNHDGPANGGNNMRVLRKRAADGKFQFYFWDMEYTFWNANENTGVTNVDFAGTIGHLFTKLRDNPEFRQRFSDRAHMHLLGDGALTPANAAARWQARADEIYTAIVAESARWGDYRRPNQPYTRDVEWAAELNRLKTQYFPVRTATLISQLQTAGLWIDVATPTFSQQGGAVPTGYPLTMTAPATPITVDTTLVAAASTAKILVPTNGSLGQTWTQIGFNNFAGWTTGPTGVGYDNQTAAPAVNYLPLIGTDIGLATPSTAEPTSVYVRQEFNVADPASISQLILRMKYDDGFVAYLNGTEVARRLAALSSATVGVPPTYNDRATGGRADADSLVYEEINISAFKNLLVPSATSVNVLAIHGLNAAPTSNDFLIMPELVARSTTANPVPPPIYYTTDGSDPRLPGGAISPLAHLYAGPVAIIESKTVVARSFVNNLWSAPNSALFTVPLSLRVDEVMFHPAGDGAAEYIEVVNIGANAIDLTGVAFTAGVNFTFAGGTLAPGERAVVVRDAAAFEAVYGPGVNVAGVFSGVLDNGGETITLSDAAGGEVQSFAYDDDPLTWHQSTDGGGASLVIINPLADIATWNSPSAWRPSRELGGSPGQRDLLRADVNGDDRVDLVDLISLQFNLGMPSGATRSDGDLNGDGAVNRGDVAILARGFGRSVVLPPPPAALVVAAPQAAARRIVRSSPRIAPMRPSFDESHVDAAVSTLDDNATLRVARQRRAATTAMATGVVANAEEALQAMRTPSRRRS